MDHRLDLKRTHQLLQLQNPTRYHVKQALGTGSFGTVVKAYDLVSESSVAIKFIHASRMHEYLCSEVRNHRILRHPHVIRFKRVFEVDGHLAIVMEYANGSSLFEVVRTSRRLSEPLGRWIFQQLILAVDYCHKKGIASRDIKCENVLLMRGQKLPIVKLSDFGYSASIKARLTKSQVGTLDYMAPEVVGCNGIESYDAMKADIWSCGVVLYVMLTGHYPFTLEGVPRREARARESVREKIKELDFTLPPQLSDSVKELITGILSHADQRMSLDDIMQHPWFLHHFPKEAMTMNAELLSAEEKLEHVPRPLNWQTDEEVESIIQRASGQCRGCANPQILSDSQIDAAFDEDIRCYAD